MKTVLTLVDFSEASANALSFAAELCKRASARLVIVNILKKGEEEEDAKKYVDSFGVRFEKFLRFRLKL